MQIFIWNFVLFVVGASAFIWAYLAFSPMTRDLVVFLSRDQLNHHLQIPACLLGCRNLCPGLVVPA
jgi:hypothetical protein